MMVKCKVGYKLVLINNNILKESFLDVEFVVEYVGGEELVKGVNCNLKKGK